MVYYVAMRQEMIPQFKSAEDLAAALSVSYPTVTQFCRTKSIRAIKFGRQWRIPNDEYERVLREGVQPKKEAGV